MLSEKSVLSAENMDMPILGFGTWQAVPEETEKAVDAALEVGYRHIDTAYVYYNETAIGNTLNKWLSSGKIKREELFIVTKLPLFGNRPEHVEKFLKESLEHLQLTYVDLYLVHSAIGLPFIEGQPFPKDDEGRLMLDLDTDHVAIWKEMERQVDEGRARAIGLSNYNQRQIQRILDNCRIKPANLQVEMNVYFQQKDLLDFCNENGITICAYAPLGSPSMPEFTESVGFSVEGMPEWKLLDDPVVASIAAKYNKSSAQVLVRFLLQYGVATIPKSANPERIKLNFDVFDFELSDEDFQQLVELDKGKEGSTFVKGIFAAMKDHPEYPF